MTRRCSVIYSGRNGRIGKIKRIEVGLPSGHYDFAGTFGQEALVAPPPNLDYEPMGTSCWMVQN